MEPVTAATYDTNFNAWKAKIESLKAQKERLRDDYLTKMRSLNSGMPVSAREPVATQPVVDTAWALFNAKQDEIDALYPSPAAAAAAAGEGGGGGGGAAAPAAGQGGGRYLRN